MIRPVPLQTRATDRDSTGSDGSASAGFRRWQLVNDPYGGRFLVLGLEGTDGSSETLGERPRDSERSYRVVRDFTRRLDERAYGATAMPPERLQRYELNYAANRDRILHSADEDVAPADVVYLVASGPGLRANVAELARIRRGVVVGVNQTARILAPERLDYFFCIDFSLGPENFPHPLPGSVGVFDVAVSPAVHALDCRRELYFLPAGRSEFYDRVRAEFPFLTKLEHGLNVTFSALAWIVRVLKARTIVLVGMDCAYTGSWRHFDEPLMFKHDAEYLVAQDSDGRAVITDPIYLAIAEWHTAVLYFLRDAGIRVINATEGGLLRHFVELKPLARTVDELNGGA